MHYLNLFTTLLACQPEGAPRPNGDATCTVGPDVVCTIVGDGTWGFNQLEGEPLDTWLFMPSADALDPEGRLVLDDYNNNVLRRLDPDGQLRAIVGNGGHGYALDGVDCRQTSIENPVDLVYGPDGTLFVYEQHGARILAVDPAGWLTVYAGDPAEPGYDRWDSDEGPAREAGMSQGWGIAADDDGTVYFAEPLSDVIRSVTPDRIIHTVAGRGDPAMGHAGSGFADGVGDKARFTGPRGVTYHDGALYVSDTGNNAIRRIELDTREVTTVAGVGKPGFAGDGGPAVDAHLFGPIGLDFGPDGALYIADSGNHAIRRVDLAGTIETVAWQPQAYGFAGDGGSPLQALFEWPNDVLVLPNGDVVVVDTLNARVRLIGDLAAP